MQEDRDYDFAIAKIPRKDKNGNDITGDKLGGGGRHRGDGTISAMAYDFKLLDEECINVHKKENIPELSTKDMLKASLIENLFIPVIERLFDELEYRAEILLVDKVLPAAKSKGKDLIANTKLVIAGIKDGIMGKETRAEQILREYERRNTELVSADVLVERINENSEEFVISEEKARIVNNMRCYAILLANEIQKYSKLCAVKGVKSDAYIEERKEFEKLMTKDIMDGIRLLLENKEQFCLDEVAIHILSEFHSGNVIWEDKCLPIPDFQILDR